MVTGSELTSPFYCFPITGGSWGVRLPCRKPIRPGAACTQEQGCAPSPWKSNAALQFAATRREESRAAALSRAALPRRSAAITSELPPVSALDTFEPDTVHPRSIFFLQHEVPDFRLGFSARTRSTHAVGLSNKGLVGSPIPLLPPSQAHQLPCTASLQAAGLTAAPPSPALLPPSAGWEQGRSLAWQDVSYGSGAKLSFCTLFLTNTSMKTM